jgi:hypothetical protein
MDKTGEPCQLSEMFQREVCAYALKEMPAGDPVMAGLD